ncbi:MAG: hypothetical protein ACE1ZA_05455, partial [Pseudomonadales bacterium]
MIPSPRLSVDPLHLLRFYTYALAHHCARAPRHFYTSAGREHTVCSGRTHGFSGTMSLERLTTPVEETVMSTAP